MKYRITLTAHQVEQLAALYLGGNPQGRLLDLFPLLQTLKEWQKIDAYERVSPTEERPTDDNDRDF